MKELNLIEILKDCPKGTKLYSTIYGEVKFDSIQNIENCPYSVRFYKNGDAKSVYKDGRDLIGYDGECTLFPSKDNRDWSTFKVEKPKWNPDTLQPFDKVLVRDDEGFMWRGDFFLFKDKTVQRYTYVCIRTIFRYCIPYNEETKHLLGTNQEEPEFYRI